MTSIAQFWDSAIVPTLVDYIRIPAKSPHFDKDWAKNGHIEAAVTLAADWCGKHPVEGMQLEIVRLHGRTPVLFIECCEESGSTDLPATLEALAPRVRAPELVVGLDSGCGNYEQLWGTTSLRGLVNGCSPKACIRGMRAGWWPRASASRGRGARQRDLRQVSVRARHAADGGATGGVGAQPQLAPGAVGDGYGVNRLARRALQGG